MLDFLDSVCSALGSAPTAPPADAVGAFWSIPVPGARKAVDALFRYVAADGFDFSIASGLAKGLAKLDGPLEPLPDALGVHICFEEQCLISKGGVYRKRIDLPYPSPAIKALCQGQPAIFGRLSLQADHAHLLPVITRSKPSDPTDWVHLSWFEHPLYAEYVLPGFMRLFRRLTRYEILGLTVSRTTGKLITRGKKQLLLPTLTWT